MTFKGTTTRSEPTAAAILQFIRDYQREWGFSPTLSEIARGCYLARTTVAVHVEVLNAKGLIYREPRKSRAIRIIDQPVSEG